MYVERYEETGMNNIKPRTREERVTIFRWLGSDLEGGSEEQGDY